MADIKSFIKSGFSTFNQAARGEYRDSRAKALGDSIFNSKHSISRSTDKEAIINDSKRVAADMRKVLAAYDHK